MKKKITTLMTVLMIICGGCSSESSVLDNENEEEVVVLTEKEKEFNRLRDKYTALVENEAGVVEVLEQEEIESWTLENLNPDFYPAIVKAGKYVETGEGAESIRDFYYKRCVTIENLNIIEEKANYIHYKMHFNYLIDDNFASGNEVSKVGQYRVKCTVDIEIDARGLGDIKFKVAYSDVILQSTAIDEETGYLSTEGWEVKDSYASISVPVYNETRNIKDEGKIYIESNRRVTIDLGKCFPESTRDFGDEVFIEVRKPDTNGEYYGFRDFNAQLTYVNYEIYGFNYGGTSSRSYLYGSSDGSLLIMNDKINNYNFLSGHESSNTGRYVIDLIGQKDGSIKIKHTTRINDGYPRYYKDEIIYIDLETGKKANGKSVALKVIKDSKIDFPLNFKLD